MSITDRLATLRVDIPSLLSHHDDCSLEPCDCGMDGIVPNLDRLISDVAELRKLALDASAMCWSSDPKKAPAASIQKMLLVLGRIA